MSNTRMAIVLDTSVCTACYACRTACQTHHGLPPDQKYVSLEFIEKGTFPNVIEHLTRKSCMHCADAPCAPVCPVNAIYTNEQGFVDVDESCIGCTICIPACPYDVPEVIDGKMHKCNGCADLVSSGQEPACVNTCMTKALRYGPMYAMVAWANGRVNQLRPQNPDANLYSTTQQGGLGMLIILRSGPEEFGLPT